ncbi:MAG: beta-ketoacyl synthase [Burkholderiales bacterium]|nr:beta-ketoacyl synthase [Burkholderiales bacterium]
MHTPIAITGMSSLSALGHLPDQVWANYSHSTTKIRRRDDAFFAAALPEHCQQQVQSLAQEQKAYQRLDPSVWYAMLVARRACAAAGWTAGIECGVNFGSSRGATQLFEHYHQEFLNHGQAATMTSPTTTLGNISSWVAQDLKLQGPAISHSVTCSTGLHAVLNGVAWLLSGLSRRFLVGGSEAALTPFTLSQMQVLKITAVPGEDEPKFPCRAGDLSKQSNTMVLGEGAAAFCLELPESADTKALAYIVGVGFASDEIIHATAISEQGIGFQQSMRMALGGRSAEIVDGIVMHAPGTVKGDLAEMHAIQAVFGACQQGLPRLTSNKWQLGHSLGAAGVLSLEMAVLMLQHQTWIPIPFIDTDKPDLTKEINTVMVNAIGFGGNAVSVLIARHA